jgi:hypothetical protein
MGEGLEGFALQFGGGKDHGEPGPVGFGGGEDIDHRRRNGLGKGFVDGPRSQGPAQAAGLAGVEGADRRFPAGEVVVVGSRRHTGGCGDVGDARAYGATDRGLRLKNTRWVYIHGVYSWCMLSV